MKNFLCAIGLHTRIGFTNFKEGYYSGFVGKIVTEVEHGWRCDRCGTVKKDHHVTWNGKTFVDVE